MATPPRTLRDIIPAFFVGPDGQPLTPEQARSREQLAMSLMERATDTSPNAGGWTSVLAKGVQGLAAGRQRHQAEEGTRVAGEQSSERVRNMLGGLGGASMGAPASQPLFAGATPSPVDRAPIDPISNRVAQAHAGGVDPDTVRSGLIERGLPPHVAEAFVVNFEDESGLNPGINEAAPLVPGSRGGFGLYQLTGPRRVAYEQFAQGQGVPLDSVDGQLDFLMQELQGPESRAARSILSAPDTATAAQAIVNDFLRPSPEHRSRRAARYAGLPGASSPSQGLPNAMMAYAPEETQSEALAAAPFASEGLQPSPTQDPIDYLSLPENQLTMDYASEGGGLSGQVAPNDPGLWGMGIDPNDLSTIPAIADGTRDVISALDPSMGAFPDAPSMGMATPSQLAPQAASGGINPAIIEALSSPYASPQERQIAGMLLQQSMGQQQAAQEQAAEMQRRQQVAQSAGIDPMFANDPELWKQAAADRFRADPTSIQEYRLAQSEGYGGSFEQFKGDMSRAGAISVDARNMGSIPPGYRVQYDDAGNPVSMEPIPGGPVAASEEADRTAREAAQRNAIDYAKTVTQDIGIADEYLGEVEQTPMVGSDGIVGANLRARRANIEGTPEFNMKQFVESALSNVTLDTMNRMRETSAAGATGFGNMSDRQVRIIQGVLGQWSPALPVEDQRMILHRLGNFYLDVQLGTKAERESAVKDGRMTPEENEAMQDLYYPETRDRQGRRVDSPGTDGGMPKPRSKADMEKLPSGTVFEAPDGSIRVRP